MLGKGLTTHPGVLDLVAVVAFAAPLDVSDGSGSEDDGVAAAGLIGKLTLCKPITTNKRILMLLCSRGAPLCQKLINAAEQTSRRDPWNKRQIDRREAASPAKACLVNPHQASNGRADTRL